MNMKATDIVNKVELDVTYDSLIELMRAGRQVDFVLPAPETDGDGYLTWDRVRAVEIALAHLKPGGMLYVSFILTFAGIIYDLQNDFKPEKAAQIRIS